MLTIGDERLVRELVTRPHVTVPVVVALEQSLGKLPSQIFHGSVRAMTALVKSCVLVLLVGTSGCFAAHEFAEDDAMPPVLAPMTTSIHISVTGGFVPGRDFASAELNIRQYESYAPITVVIASQVRDFSSVDTAESLNDEFIGLVDGLPYPARYVAEVRLLKADGTLCYSEASTFRSPNVRDMEMHFPSGGGCSSATSPDPQALGI